MLYLPLMREQLALRDHVQNFPVSLTDGGNAILSSLPFLLLFLLLLSLLLLFRIFLLILISIFLNLHLLHSRSHRSSPFFSLLLSYHLFF